MVLSCVIASFLPSLFAPLCLLAYRIGNEIQGGRSAFILLSDAKFLHCLTIDSA